VLFIYNVDSLHFDRCTAEGIHEGVVEIFLFARERDRRRVFNIT